MEEISQILQMKQALYPLSCVDGPTLILKIWILYWKKRLYFQNKSLSLSINVQRKTFSAVDVHMLCRAEWAGRLQCFKIHYKEDKEVLWSILRVCRDGRSGVEIFQNKNLKDLAEVSDCGTMQVFFIILKPVPYRWEASRDEVEDPNTWRRGRDWRLSNVGNVKRYFFKLWMVCHVIIQTSTLERYMIV